MQGTSNCGGLISGNLVVTHKGTLDVLAHGTGLTMRLAFKEPGMFASKRSSKHEVRGCLPTGDCAFAHSRRAAGAQKHGDALFLKSLGRLSLGRIRCLSAEPGVNRLESFSWHTAGLHSEGACSPLQVGR
jgi:hypothetical protein